MMSKFLNRKKNNFLSSGDYYQGFHALLFMGVVYILLLPVVFISSDKWISIFVYLLLSTLFISKSLCNIAIILASPKVKISLGDFYFLFSTLVVFCFFVYFTERNIPDPAALSDTAKGVIIFAYSQIALLSIFTNLKNFFIPKSHLNKNIQQRLSFCIRPFYFNSRDDLNIPESAFLTTRKNLYIAFFLFSTALLIITYFAFYFIINI